MDEHGVPIWAIPPIEANSPSYIDGGEVVGWIERKQNETGREKNRTSRFSVAAHGRHPGVRLGAVSVLWRRSLGDRRGGAFRAGLSKAAAIDAGQTKPRGRAHRSDHYRHGHPAAGDDRGFAGAGSVKPVAKIQSGEYNLGSYLQRIFDALGLGHRIDRAVQSHRLVVASRKAHVRPHAAGKFSPRRR